MTQTIPLVYAVLKDLKLHSGPASRIGDKWSVEDRGLVNSIESIKPKKERGKIIVVDVEGVNKGQFNAPFMEFCKVSGNELWLIEPIYDDDDVLDAFIGYADKLVFPYDCIKNDSELRKILDISDNCVPLLPCHNGKCEEKSLLELVEMLSETGFHNIMVADLDGSISDQEWEDLLSECGGLIAYSPLKDLPADMHIVAEDVFPVTFSQN